MLNPLLNLEFEERAKDFELAVAEWQATVARWAQHTGFVVVADTNVFIEHREAIDEQDWSGIVGAAMAPVHLVVPTIVIDELDKAKRNHRRDVPARARATLQTLERLLLGAPTSSAKLLPATAVHGPVSVELLLDPLGHVRLDDSDDELADRVLALAARVGREVHFVTGDHGALFRGAVQGLSVHHLPVPESRQ
jgi:predicted ribonuclease YlaK